MTIIAAAYDKTNKKMIMMADSLVSYETYHGYTNKLIKINDGFYLGYSGYCRLGDMIKEHIKYYQNYIDPKDIFELIRDDWISLKDKDNITMLLGATKNKIFVMYSNHSIEVVKDYAMIGSGSDMCRAVYYNNNKLLKASPESSLELAMRTTIDVHATCGGKLKKVILC